MWDSLTVYHQREKLKGLKSRLRVGQSRTTTQIYRRRLLLEPIFKTGLFCRSHFNFSKHFDHTEICDLNVGFRRLGRSRRTRGRGSDSESESLMESSVDSSWLEGFGSDSLDSVSFESESLDPEPSSSNLATRSSTRYRLSSSLESSDSDIANSAFTPYRSRNQSRTSFLSSFCLLAISLTDRSLIRSSGLR